MASFIAPNLSQLRPPRHDLSLLTDPRPFPASPLLAPLVPRLPRLPDLLTTANLCCGVASILLASQGQLTIACGLIFLAAVFDVFDGLAARALGGGTPLGAQLDSLADMVSFGVAPAFLVLQFGPIADLSDLGLLHIGPLFMIIAAAWRLAKFNVDHRQTSTFLGLPTPANALLWASMVLAIVSHGPNGILGLEGNLVLRAGITFLLNQPFTILICCLACAFLMLSELPLPSLKFKHNGWKGNEVIFLLLGLGAILVLLYGVLAVPLILIIYLLSPLWGKLFHRNAETQRR